jgi:hypothetical protein
VSDNKTLRSAVPSGWKDAGGNPAAFQWIELVKTVALPLVTLLLGAMFNASLNTRQVAASEANLLTEMTARREQADSDLRKDMFQKILDTFMNKDPKLVPERVLQQQVLNLELLAYNFHQSLDIGPLFKDVRRRIPDGDEGWNVALRTRLEKVAHEVIERQLTTLSDRGTVEVGDAAPTGVNDLQAYVSFGSHAVPDPKVKPGAGVSRLCLSMDSVDMRHYRQFKLELLAYDAVTRELQIRLYVSQPISEADCQKPDVDLAEKREIDTNFWVGLFDFPMIDNTRLTHSERCAVSLTDLNSSVLKIAVSYFPASRASLKDMPYYDEVLHDLEGDRASGLGAH